MNPTTAIGGCEKSVASSGAESSHRFFETTAAFCKFWVDRRFALQKAYGGEGVRQMYIFYCPT